MILKFYHWNAIDSNWKYVARDADGRAWFYENEPSCYGSGWVAQGEVACAKPLEFTKAFLECDWKDSLIGRLEGE